MPNVLTTDRIRHHKCNGRQHRPGSVRRRPKRSLLGDGADSITVSGSASVTNILSNEGADTITINGAGVVILNQVLGGTGSDSITVTAGNLGANILGQEDNDVITINGANATVQLNVEGGLGADLLTLSAGLVEGNIDGGDQRDTLRVTGGTYLVAGGAMEKLEGDGDLPSAVVVVSFPNKDAALAFHNDPEYAPLIALRQAGSDCDMLVVEGTD